VSRDFAVVIQWNSFFLFFFSIFILMADLEIHVCLTYPTFLSPAAPLLLLLLPAFPLFFAISPAGGSLDGKEFFEGSRAGRWRHGEDVAEEQIHSQEVHEQLQGHHWGGFYLQGAYPG